MLTAIDRDLGPADISSVVAAQEKDRAGDVGRYPEPVERDARQQDCGLGDSIAVSISPGATALTRTPSRAKSAAISRVRADNAAFEVE